MVDPLLCPLNLRLFIFLRSIYISFKLKVEAGTVTVPASFWRCYFVLTFTCKPSETVSTMRLEPLGTSSAMSMRPISVSTLDCKNRRNGRAP